MTILPTSPVVPILETAGVAQQAIPSGVVDFLRRERVPLTDACAFLGFERQTGYPMAHRYLKRIERERRKAEMAGRPLDRCVLVPRRDSKTGIFTEIPCYRVGHKVMTRTDYVVPMAYPEVAWP